MNAPSIRQGKAGADQPQKMAVTSTALHPVVALVCTMVSAWGLYELVLTVTLLLRHRRKARTLVYRLSCLAAFLHSVTVILYLRISDFLTSQARPTTIANSVIVTSISGALTHALILYVGLVRYKSVFSSKPFRFWIKNRSCAAFVGTYTPHMVYMIMVTIVVSGVVNGIVAGRFLILGDKSPQAIVRALPHSNIFSAFAMELGCFADVFLASSFLFSIVQKQTAGKLSLRFLMVSREAHRLGFIIFLSLLFAVPTLVGAVTDLVADPPMATSIDQGVAWSSFVVCLWYPFALNTFIIMSYATTRSLMILPTDGLITTVSENHSLGRNRGAALRRMQSYEQFTDFNPGAGLILAGSSETQEVAATRTGVKISTKNLVLAPKAVVGNGGRDVIFDQTDDPEAILSPDSTYFSPRTPDTPAFPLGSSERSVRLPNISSPPFQAHTNTEKPRDPVPGAIDVVDKPDHVPNDVMPSTPVHTPPEDPSSPHFLAQLSPATIRMIQLQIATPPRSSTHSLSTTKSSPLKYQYRAGNVRTFQTTRSTSPLIWVIGGNKIGHVRNGDGLVAMSPMRARVIQDDMRARESGSVEGTASSPSIEVSPAAAPARFEGIRLSMGSPFKSWSSGERTSSIGSSLEGNRGSSVSPSSY
ncbi:hypothetical protein BJ742DRAFT_838445 [Cladochytrium replicatum]|nr:hypothetical protein BJ742DRAFT_838445 [Cladochytrium replicatum]